MNNPVAALKRIQHFIADWEDGDTNATMSWVACKTFIRDLRDHAESEDIENRVSRLSSLETHVDAMFSPEQWDYEGFERHKSFAMQDASLLQDWSCFGEQ